MPLFSTVMTTAGLRSVLRASPTSSQLDLQAQTSGLSTKLVYDISTNFNATFQHALGSYLTKTIQRSIQVYDFTFPNMKKNTELSVYAAWLYTLYSDHEQ